MHRDEIGNLLKALPEGRQVHVFHHDFALLSPDGRTLIAYGPDRSLNIIDVMLISSVHIEPPPENPPTPEANGPVAA
jgi:hypothetical protein